MNLFEVQHITLACRTNRTKDGAWDEAVRRLREIYDAQVDHDPGVTVVLTIARGETVPMSEHHKEIVRSGILERMGPGDVPDE